MSRNSVVIIGHQGLGDQIIVNGLYREFARDYEKVVLPINKRNYPAVKAMLSDVSNIKVVCHGTKMRAMQIEAQARMLHKLGHDLLLLGRYHHDFYDDMTIRFDQKFYEQAGIDFNHRWESFNIPRNLRKEQELFDLLVGGKKDYIFLHDDESRNYLIKRELLPKGIEIVRPNIKLSKSFNFFDYLGVIEKSKEVHCMESSFAALIEGAQVDIPKYAHRYARPEAKGSLHFEFTYKSNWEILK